jgi:hypothetical protein
MGRPSPSDLLKIHVGRRLRVAQDYLRLDQRAFAALLQTQPTTLSNWQNGLRLADTSAVLRLMRRSDFTPNFILGGLLSGMDHDMRQAVESLAATHQACIGGPVPEWPMAADHRALPPAPAAVPKRPARMRLHEAQQPPPAASPKRPA